MLWLKKYFKSHDVSFREKKFSIFTYYPSVDSIEEKKISIQLMQIWSF